MVYLAHQSLYPTFGVINVVTRNLKYFRLFKILVGFLHGAQFILQLPDFLILGLKLAAELGIGAFDGFIKVRKLTDLTFELLNQSGIVFSHG